MAMFKIFVLPALLACVYGGGPASYSISTLSGDYTSVGNAQEHTVKGPYGHNAHSQYSVETPYSSVRVLNSRHINDALGYVPGYYGSSPVQNPLLAPPHSPYPGSYPVNPYHHISASYPSTLPNPYINHGYQNYGGYGNKYGLYGRTLPSSGYPNIPVAAAAATAATAAGPLVASPYVAGSVTASPYLDRVPFSSLAAAGGAPLVHPNYAGHHHGHAANYIL